MKQMMHPQPRPAAVTLWLLACCSMIFVMALVGAITRLTESGLSITKWDPIMGALPPMSTEAWSKAFTDYQQIPQYQLLNKDMTLEGFKHIFFWEWFHRLWGRLIGVVLFVPLVFFTWRKQITRALTLRLIGIFALGGLQGFIGWFMVQSGLETRTTVSPYRLALHLGFALTLYALLLWTTLGGTNLKRRVVACGLRLHGWLALGLLAITMIWGAFVAGMRAGLIYNTWPLMGGDLLPPDGLNILADPGAVQFAHRWLGPLTMIVLLSWVIRAWKGAGAQSQKWLAALACMSLLQVALGIGTLLSYVQIHLAVTHQAGAITLLSLLVINLYLVSEKTKSGK